MILDKCNKLSPWARYKTRVYENMKSECKEAFVDAIRILKAAFVVSRDASRVPINFSVRCLFLSKQKRSIVRRVITNN